MRPTECFRSAQRHPRKDAFTMIELMLIALVLGILGSMALRSMFVFAEQRKLRTAAVELSGYLQVARNVANAHSTPCTIQYTPTGGVFEPDDSKAINSCVDGRLPPAVRLAGLAGSRALKAEILSGAYPLTFTPEGTVASGATVLLTSADVPTGGWCVDVQAPLATVRLGWRSTGSICRYTNEQ